MAKGATEPRACPTLPLSSSCPPPAPQPLRAGGQRLSSLLQLTNHVTSEITSRQPRHFHCHSHSCCCQGTYLRCCHIQSSTLNRESRGPQESSSSLASVWKSNSIFVLSQCLDGCFIIDQTGLYRERLNKKNLKRLLEAADSVGESSPNIQDQRPACV